MVSSLIQISKRSATINKLKGAADGHETGLFTATFLLRLQISR